MSFIQFEYEPSEAIMNELRDQLSIIGSTIISSSKILDICGVDKMVLEERVDTYQSIIDSMDNLLLDHCKEFARWMIENNLVDCPHRIYKHNDVTNHDKRRSNAYKVTIPGESFWISIVTEDFSYIYGVVDNELIHELDDYSWCKFGATVKWHKEDEILSKWIGPICFNDKHLLYIIKERIFLCKDCGEVFHRVQGELDQCSECHSWNHLITEELKACIKCPMNVWEQTEEYIAFREIADKLNANMEVDLNDPSVQRVKSIIDTQKAYHARELRQKIDLTRFLNRERVPTSKYYLPQYDIPSTTDKRVFDKNDKSTWNCPLSDTDRQMLEQSVKNANAIKNTYTNTCLEHESFLFRKDPIHYKPYKSE